MFRRTLAMIVVAALLGVVLPQPALAAPSALLEGRVLGSDGSTPLRGVVVNLLDAKSRVTFPSVPTNDRGVFHAAAPAGSYRVVADTPRGAYLASGEIRLRDGHNPPLSLTLQQGAPEGGTSTPPPPPPSPPPTDAPKGQLAPWAKWTIVGGIVVGGLLVIDSVTSDEAPPAASDSGVLEQGAGPGSRRRGSRRSGARSIVDRFHVRSHSATFRSRHCRQATNISPASSRQVDSIPRREHR
jgi:hypothetical protein